MINHNRIRWLGVAAFGMLLVLVYCAVPPGEHVFPIRFPSDVITDSAGVWGPTQVVSTESTGYSEGPSLAVDPSGNVHVAWTDCSAYGGSHMYYDIQYKMLTTRTGTWSTVQTIATRHANNPSLAVDSTGNVHVAYEDYLGTSWDIYYRMRDSKTGGWSTAQPVSTERDDSSESPSIGVDNAGNVHVVWFDFIGYGPSMDILYKFRNASIGTWSTTQVVSTESTGHAQYPSLDVDAAGNVHVAWKDGTNYLGKPNAGSDIFYKVRNATTGRWSMTQMVSPRGMAFSEDPSLAIDAKGNVPSFSRCRLDWECTRGLVRRTNPRYC